MLRACPVWIWDRTRPGADRVWGELNSLETYGTAKSAFPSIAHLVRACGMGRDAVIAGIRALEEIGAVVVERQDGKPNRYFTLLDPPENRGETARTSRKNRLVENSQENAGETSGISQENGGSDQSEKPTLSTEALGGTPSLPEPGGSDKQVLGAPFARGISPRALIGAWLAAGWGVISCARYTITGPDRAVLKDGAAAFIDEDEARSYFAEVVPWMTRDQFWKDHVSLKGALTLRNRHQTEGLGGIRAVDTTLSDLKAQMREIDPVAFDRAQLNGQSRATVSTRTLESRNGDGGPAG